MKAIAFALLTMAASSDSHGGTWVNWIPNYPEALNRSHESSKPLLLVIDNPSEPNLRTEHTCRPLDKMQAELLNNYERCHVDVTTNHGKQVAKAFGVQRFPFVAIIDTTASRVLYRKTGKIHMAEWIGKLAVHGGGETSRLYVAAQENRASRPSRFSIQSSNVVRSSCYT